MIVEILRIKKSSWLVIGGCICMPEKKQFDYSQIAGITFAQLKMEGFLFDALNNNDIEKYIRIIEKLINIIPKTWIKVKTVYRTRKINVISDIHAGKGIDIINGKIVGGFDSYNSGMAPMNSCKLGRLNRDKERVFYVAEEIITAINEQKTAEGDILSIAKYRINGKVSVLDFAAYSKSELQEVISNDSEKRFLIENGYSARTLYLEIQRFFTVLESNPMYYEVSNKIADIIKNRFDIDGIRYYSYCGGHNIAIWGRKKDYNDFLYEGAACVCVTKETKELEDIIFGNPVPVTRGGFVRIRYGYRSFRCSYEYI